MAQIPTCFFIHTRPSSVALLGFRSWRALVPQASLAPLDCLLSTGSMPHPLILPVSRCRHQLFCVYSSQPAVRFSFYSVA